jgi:replicative DNA helicase
VKNEKIKKTMTLEQQLYEYAGEDRVITSHEMQAEIKSRKSSKGAINVGFPELDRTLGGFRLGELVTVSGLTGEGKTTICKSFTRNLTRREVGCLWFSYELLSEDFLESFGDSLPVFDLPRMLKESAITWLERRIIEAKLKYDCRVVFIDHLHYLVDLRTHHNMSLEIGFVMRSLKKIAISQRVCIFLIAHLGKIKTGEEEPDTLDLRDSSFVGQESDNILIIWRRAEDSPKGVVKVAKNRKKGVRKKIAVEKIGDFFYEEGDIVTTHE